MEINDKFEDMMGIFSGLFSQPSIQPAMCKKMWNGRKDFAGGSEGSNSAGNKKNSMKTISVILIRTTLEDGIILGVFMSIVREFEQLGSVHCLLCFCFE